MEGNEKLDTETVAGLLLGFAHMVREAAQEPRHAPYQQRVAQPDAGARTERRIYEDCVRRLDDADRATLRRIIDLMLPGV